MGIIVFYTLAYQICLVALCVTLTIDNQKYIQMEIRGLAPARQVKINPQKLMSHLAAQH